MSSMSQTAVRGSYYFHPLQRVIGRLAVDLKLSSLL